MCFNCQALGSVGFVEISITNGVAIIPNIEFADFSKLKVKKINRKHLVDGSFIYKEELSNEYNCSVELFKKQGGEYRKTAYKLPMKGCCDFYNTDTFLIPEMQPSCENCPKQLDKVCPLPAVS